VHTFGTYEIDVCLVFGESKKESSSVGIKNRSYDNIIFTFRYQNFKRVFLKTTFFKVGGKDYPETI